MSFDTFEILAICGTTFGIAGFLLAAVAILIFVRMHYHSPHHRRHVHSGQHIGMNPVAQDSDSDDGEYNGALYPGPVSVDGKHYQKTSVHVIDQSGHPTRWRPFWPLFCCIILVTLALVSVPILIWLADDGVHHHFHHHGDDSSSIASSGAASSATSGSVI